MNRQRLLLIAFLAIAIAGALTFVAFRTLNRAIASAKRPMTKVVLAAVDIPVGTRIKDSDLKLGEMPTGNLPAGVATSKEAIVGRGVIIPIQKSDVVTDGKLASLQGGSGLPSLIPANMRAVSVKVNDVIAVAGFVVPGTRVDVLLTGYPTGRSEGQAMTTTVLENVEVLAAGRDMQQNPEGGKPQSVPVITLLVTPADAQKLALASSEGKIQLALRNPLDLETATIPSVKNVALYHAEVVPQKIAAKPAKAVKIAAPVTDVYMVEVIRGEKREITKF